MLTFSFLILFARNDFNENFLINNGKLETEYYIDIEEDTKNML
jgi:hypothetical protein